MPMKLADLTRWTPVRLDFSGPAPAIYWADLSAERFVEPFFDQTVARWASGPRARPLVRTGLDALVALDSEPSLEPVGMIFHLSRCGSTLVSRLLGTLPGVVVLAEPAPLNALLGLDQIDDATLVKIVRLAVRALGRCRHADERRLVLKCTSWNIRHRAILAAAFPETPWIWLQRDPARILPPDQHERIWDVQKPLNFPLTVYGIDRAEADMVKITRKLADELGAHAGDRVE